MEAKLNKKLIKSLTKKTSANQPRLIKHVKCDTPAQGLIGLIGYSYQQVATSFPEAGLQELRG